MKPGPIKAAVTFEHLIPFDHDRQPEPIPDERQEIVLADRPGRHMVQAVNRWNVHQNQLYNARKLSGRKPGKDRFGESLHGLSPLSKKPLQQAGLP